MLDAKAQISRHNQSAEHLLSLPLDKAEGQVAKFLPGLDWDKLCAEDATDSLSVTGMNWRSPIP